MGQNFSSEPVVEKETERDHNDTFNVAVSSCQGWRMSQEDNHSLMLELPGEHKAAFFAVYDGHGSARVSKHASEGLWRHLVENENYLKGNFKEALETSFLTFDREVNESYNAQLAGTTAVCVLVVDNFVYCANIGDSRAVASVNCECVPLSYDHKPENPQELKRILAAGGYVLGNRVNGNLALSRAFGDFHYKGNEQLPPEQQIVSPCPDVKRIELNDDVDFLVLACDGIWDVLSSEEVVEFVISRLEQSMELGLICEQLTTRCLATDYELVIGCDNMTVLLVCYTRGRSWVDFCTDIFNKNTGKLGGIPRIRPTNEESALSLVEKLERERDTDRSDNFIESDAKDFYDSYVLKSDDTGKESTNKESKQDDSELSGETSVPGKSCASPETPSSQTGDVQDEKQIEDKQPVCSITDDDGQDQEDAGPDGIKEPCQEENTEKTPHEDADDNNIVEEECKLGAGGADDENTEQCGFKSEQLDSASTSSEVEVES